MAFPSPTTAAPTLNDWQFHLNGWTFGTGTPWGVLSVTGLDLPQIRTGDAGRPLDQGQLIGLDLLGGRSITFDLWVHSDTTSLQSALKTLAKATEVGGTTETPLWVKLPNQPLLACMVRARKRKVKVDQDYGAAFVAKPTFQLHATDPRFYGTTESTSVALGTPVAGMTFPATFPLSFGGGTTGVLTLDNTGDFEMRPVLVFEGPLTNPAAANTSIAGSPQLTFSNPNQTGYTLGAGDKLVVDLDLHTVTYYVAGTTIGSPVRFWLATGSTWWNLQPGTNDISFTSGDATTVAGTLTVQWAPAYISAT